LPANIKTAQVFTSQPGGAIPIFQCPSYPNLLGVDPGTRVELYAFNHDTVQWYIYGYGRQHRRRTIAPEIDPSTGRQYGLRDFSWHFPNAARAANPEAAQGKDKDCGDSNRWQSSGFLHRMKMDSATDIMFQGARGVWSLPERIRRPRPNLRRVSLRRGTTHNYAIRLTGSFQSGGSGRVVMPEEVRQTLQLCRH